MRAITIPIIVLILFFSAGSIASAQTKTYMFTQPVTVGNFEYKIVRGIYRGQRLESTNQFEPSRTTAGKYIEVIFTVKNLGKDPNAFDDTGGVIDSLGRKFGEIDGNDLFVAKENYCSYVDEIQPTFTRTCSAIFEVAADSKGFVIVFVDQEMFGADEARVWLGG